jgi:hypothetical protein
MGYIKFFEAFDSDHRAIYCDLSNKIFEDHDSCKTIKRKRIVGSNSTNIEGQNYIEYIYIYQHMQHQNIFQRLEELLHKTRSRLPQNKSAIDKLNEIDKFITITMLKVEMQQCKKKDQVLWTPKVYQLNLQIPAEKRSNEIKRKMDDTNIAFIESNSSGLNASLQYAIKEHNIICKNSIQNKNEYLENLVKDLQERTNSEHVTIKQI